MAFIRNKYMRCASIDAILAIRIGSDIEYIFDFLPRIESAQGGVNDERPFGKFLVRVELRLFDRCSKSIKGCVFIGSEFNVCIGKSETRKFANRRRRADMHIRKKRPGSSTGVTRKLLCGEA